MYFVQPSVDYLGYHINAVTASQHYSRIGETGARAQDYYHEIDLDRRNKLEEKGALFRHKRQGLFGISSICHKAENIRVKL
ncbi:jg21390 [Pararge aegeria aegeria]|uniref:Jg21390 protein n=1 Tax=Pararge aegeria aegeria TaxID=348720 RepID=A0A8S4S153_9NEOP|nr:jg21390 [Pararge aegeria aegeria]